MLQRPVAASPVRENPIELRSPTACTCPPSWRREWPDVFDRFLGPGWSHRLRRPSDWKPIDEIPDHIFWSTCINISSRRCCTWCAVACANSTCAITGSEAHLDRILRHADPDNPNVLTIGFGRRFATYKRATLLFEDIEWLKQIVSDPQRPVLFVFAGTRASGRRARTGSDPAVDGHLAHMPEFEGKILLVEDYDLRLARWLVSGVDVWLNNPIYPLEASGTSGMKAGMNGVINLSVLDGWWGEGYDGDNGWAIKPAAQTARSGAAATARNRARSTKSCRTR